MVGSELFLLPLQSFLQQRQGLVDSFSSLISRAHVVHRTQCIGVVRSKPLPSSLQHLLPNCKSLLKLVIGVVCGGDIAHGRKRFGVIRPELFASPVQPSSWSAIALSTLPASCIARPSSLIDASVSP